MAQGALGVAESLLDLAAPDPAERALVATLRWRQGRSDEAAASAQQLIGAKVRRVTRLSNRRDACSVIVQAGLVSAATGDVPSAHRAVLRVNDLLGGIEGFESRWSYSALFASTCRQQEKFDVARFVLSSSLPEVQANGADAARLELELARLLRAQASDAAGPMYATAAATFEGSGDHWYAAHVRDEAGPSRPT